MKTRRGNGAVRFFPTSNIEAGTNSPTHYVYKESVHQKKSKFEFSFCQYLKISESKFFFILTTVKFELKIFPVNN